MKISLDTFPSRMFCCTCGYALVGLPNNRCPECGREFDPGNPTSFLSHPLRIIRRRIVKLSKIVLVLFCVTLPVDAYFGYLDWQFHREKKAIGFLEANDAAFVSTYDTTPAWAKELLHGHAGWLWERADEVDMSYFNPPLNMPQRLAAVAKLKSLRKINLHDPMVNQISYTQVQITGNIPVLAKFSLENWKEREPMTDAGLAQLTGLTALQELSLLDTQVTDAGMAYLQGFSALQKLDLSNTQVTDAGLARIKGLTALKELRLMNTQVTDAGLAHLEGLTALQQLALGNWQERASPITDAGLVHLNTTALQLLF